MANVCRCSLGRENVESYFTLTEKLCNDMNGNIRLCVVQEATVIRSLDEWKEAGGEMIQLKLMFTNCCCRTRGRAPVWNEISHTLIKIGGTCEIVHCQTSPTTAVFNSAGNLGVTLGYPTELQSPYNVSSSWGHGVLHRWSGLAVYTSIGRFPPAECKLTPGKEGIKRVLILSDDTPKS